MAMALSSRNSARASSWCSSENGAWTSATTGKPTKLVNGSRNGVAHRRAEEPHRVGSRRRRVVETLAVDEPVSATQLMSKSNGREPCSTDGARCTATTSRQQRRDASREHPTGIDSRETT